MRRFKQMKYCINDCERKMLSETNGQENIYIEFLPNGDMYAGEQQLEPLNIESIEYENDYIELN